MDQQVKFSSCGKAFLCFSLVTIIGCTKETTQVNTGGRISPTYQGPSETAYCSSAVSYSNTVTITGTAAFQYRQHFGSLFSGGLGGVESSTKPIRRAEVRVLDTVGNVKQCAETDASGNFSFTLPKDTGVYQIQVNSRANNSHAKVTVFNRPEQNQFYTLLKSVGSSSSASVGTMTAPATDSVIAGAFNILDQVVEANEYLKANVGTGTCGGSGCAETDVAPKVQIFWEKGFNPGSYFGSGGLSFYLPGYSRLFILGGVDGDVDTSDTDHFDNSVILHEYGHFLEDAVFESDSPGGSHNGDAIIDPRLAWSEGWGNFFQAAVRGDATYIDTTGNSDGGGSNTAFLFYVNIEDSSSPLYDNPQAGPNNSKAHGTDGEGNFREFSVTRILWDSIDTVIDNNSLDADNISGGFTETWTALTHSNDGWVNSKWAFRSIGLMHSVQDGLGGGTDWSSIRTMERQIASRLEYAQYVESDGGCADANFYVTLTPVDISGDTGVYSTSDLYRNNDFYHFKLGSTTDVTLTLTYEDTDSAGAEADLDLYLYDEDARFGVEEDWQAYSREEPSAGYGTETETASKANLAAGNYLINVMAYTGGNVGTAVKYSLTLNGVKLCQKDPP